MNDAIVSVLVPLYNEEKTIEKVLSKLDQLGFVKEIIVVDDCSTDNSFSVVKNYQSNKVQLFQNPKNLGKTGAINLAKEKASGEIIVIQDADLEYNPDEYPKLLAPIVSGHADVVYGSRFLVKKTCRVLYFYHYLANKFLTFLSNLLTNHNMSDNETCYKAFKAPIFKNMELKSKGFGMEVEITAMITRLPIKIYEVPISYYGRTYEEGKKIGMTDGIMAIIYILYFNLISPYKPSRKNYFKTVPKLLLEN